MVMKDGILRTANANEDMTKVGASFWMLALCASSI